MKHCLSRPFLFLMLLVLLGPILASAQQPALLINGNRTHAGATNYRPTTGSSTAYVLTLNAAIPGYVDGMCVLMRVHVDNTGDSTLNVNGRGAIPMRKWSAGAPVALAAGDLRATQHVQACYDSAVGPRFQVMSLGGGGAATGGMQISEINGADLGTYSLLKFSNGAVTNNGDGTATIVTGVAGGGDVSSNTATAVDNEIALFSGTGGKTIKRATTSGILFGTNGALSAATAGTHFVAPGGALGTPSSGNLSQTTGYPATALTGRLPYTLLTAPTTTSRLLGRGTTSGNWEEITISTGLTMTGNVLTAAGGTAGGNPLVLDLGNNGSNESADLLKITTTGDTNGIFSEPNADELRINLAADWPKADLADALANDPANCITPGTFPNGVTANGAAENCTPLVADPAGNGLVNRTSQTTSTPVTSNIVGQVLRVTGPNAFGFGALDLSDPDALTGDLPYANLTPSLNPARLLGRTDASAGDWGEISLGSGLAMNGTVLSNTAGGGNVSNVGVPLLNQVAVWTSASQIAGNAPLTYSAGTLQVGTSAAPATLGRLALAGSTAGVVTLTPPANFTSYAWNAPATAGTAGQALLSGGGGANPMTWTTLAPSATTDTTNAANIATGTLAVARGGTGTGTTLTGFVRGSASAMTATELSGDVLTNGSGAATIQPNVVNYAKMQDVGGESRLIGRGQGAGGGDPQEIILGTNLTMSGTTLNASGGTGSGDITDVGTCGGPACFTQASTAASLFFAPIATPVAPSSGSGRLYVDSIGKNLMLIDDAGIRTHTVRTQIPATSFFVTGLNDAGALSTAQPNSTDLGDAATLAKLNPTSQTLTNTRVTPRPVTAGPGSPIAINTDITDQVHIPDLTGGTTTFSAPTGTPTNGQRFTMTIRTTATAPQTLVWTQTAGGFSDETGIGLPKTSLPGTYIVLVFRWNVITSLWDLEYSSRPEPQGIQLTDEATIGTTTPINCDKTQFFFLTDVGGTRQFANPVCTPRDGQLLRIRLTSTAPRTLTWASKYSGALGLNLPTTTSGGSPPYDLFGFQYHLASDKWQFIATTQNSVSASPDPQGIQLTDEATIGTTTAINCDKTQFFFLTDVGGNRQFANPVCTPRDGQLLRIRLTSTAPRTLTWSSKYSGAMGLNLPTTTSGGSPPYDLFGFQYHLALDQWQLISTSQTSQTALTKGCILAVEGDVAITDAKLSKIRMCPPIGPAGTVVEIGMYADAGTPSIIPHRRSATTNTDLLPAGGLATAAAGAYSCKRKTAGQSQNGSTACTSGLQNETYAGETSFGMTSGIAGGTATQITMVIYYQPSN